jgi:BirA family biotin operon repressor/biotin-[acetyl-CoA-carboxylase] ligase
VVAALVDELIVALGQFQRDGLLPFMQAWRDADALHGAEARVSLGDKLHRGIARGIDAEGALMLETPAGVLRFISGEVSVRSAG